MDICICITDSLCCTAETNTTFKINYTPIIFFKATKKLVVVKKFNELQENSERQYNDLRNKINEQKYFNKEIEILKKNQTNSGAEELNK